MLLQRRGERLHILGPQCAVHQQLLADQLSGRQRSLRVAVVLLAGRVLLLVAARELAADSGTRRGRAAAGTAAAVALRDIRDLQQHRI